MNTAGRFVVACIARDIGKVEHYVLSTVLFSFSFVRRHDYSYINNLSKIIRIWVILYNFFMDFAENRLYMIEILIKN